MEAKELRIGNIVQMTVVKEPLRVKRIDPRSVHLDTIESIPLTEEWLLKVGFIKDKTEIAVYYKEDFEIQLPIYFKWKDSNLNKIKHVHQLQNLYFALTGTELTIKE